MLTAIAQADAIQAVDLTVYLGTVAGIALATMILVEGVKRVVVSVPIAKDLPTFLYAIVLALGLTALSIALGVFETPPTTGREWALLLIQAAVTAAVASGAREWVTKGATTPASSAAGKALLLACILAAGLTGCASVGEVSFIEASGAYHASKADDLDALRQSELLSADELQSRVERDAAFGEAIAARRRAIGLTQ
jgi:hypothetical protein